MDMLHYMETGEVRGVKDLPYDEGENRMPESKGLVVQDWLADLPFMQQTVLLSAIRGCDGKPKEHRTKPLVRWLRRCILKSAVDGSVFTDPVQPGGGEFMRPIWTHPTMDGADWRDSMGKYVDDYCGDMDDVPMHFHLHFLHATEILGQRHPNLKVRLWWRRTYMKITNAMHLRPEPRAGLDARLHM